MKNGIRVKQRDITDCGAACLASVAAHFGLNMTVSRIRQYASTDKKGTNLLGLIEASEKLGFQAKGVKGPFESLSKVPLPAIAHVIVKEVLHHYMVVYEVTPSHVKVMDPADGNMRKIDHQEFKKIWTGILLLIIPTESFSRGDKQIPLFSKFLELIQPHRDIMIQSLAGALVYTILGLSMSIYIQKIVDHVIIDANQNLLNLLSIGMIVILVFQLLIGYMKSLFVIRTGQLIDAQLILGYYKHLLKLPQQFFDTMRVGEIISRVNDAVKIRAFINDVSVNLAVNVFIVVFSFALMFTYYWKLALVLLLIIPFYGLIYLIVNQLNKKVERKVMEESADLESQLVESLNSVNTIKSFGLEPFANLKTEARFVKLLHTVYRSGTNNLFSGFSTEFVSRLFTIILLWAGAGFVIDQSITPGELLSFYALIGYFTGPVSSLIGMNKTVQNALIAADRLFEIMDLEQENDSNKVKLTPDLMGDIRLRNVHFRYGSRVSVFEDLSIDIPHGKVTAIVGESGSGKSTLAAILQKLYPLKSGNVFIGEYDLNYVDNASLRAAIGVVPQTIDLFAGNVIENIAVGDFEPDMKKIVSICSSLGILDFIEKLPQGFETYLGENGASLSGGQKQRVAIARALYKDPELLILDEATSALDSASEQYVQKMISYMSDRQRTIVLIAHRLSTVFHAHKIIVLDKGRAVEEGNHHDLMALKGHYYRLWAQQFPMLETMNR